MPVYMNRYIWNDSYIELRTHQVCIVDVLFIYKWPGILKLLHIWLNFRKTGHLFTYPWITIVSIVISFVLQKILTHVNEVDQSGRVFWSCSICQVFTHMKYIIIIIIIIIIITVIIIIVIMIIIVLVYTTQANNQSNEVLRYLKMTYLIVDFSRSEETQSE